MRACTINTHDDDGVAVCVDCGAQTAVVLVAVEPAVRLRRDDLARRAALERAVLESTAPRRPPRRVRVRVRVRVVKPTLTDDDADRVLDYWEREEAITCATGTTS